MNTASYIPWLYTTWDQMVASNMIHCVFSSDDNNHYTSFLYQVQAVLVYYLKANPLHIIKNYFTSLKVVEDSTKTTRTLWKNVCVPISMILVLVLNELVLPVMALVEQLKRHVAKRRLQRSFNNQILGYKAILDLWETEMMSIKIFGIVRKHDQCWKSWDWEMIWRWGHCTRQHLVPLSSSRNGPKLTSEDKLYVDIQSVSLCDLCIQLILVGWHG